MELVRIGDHEVEIEVVPPWSGYANCPIQTCEAMPLRADADTQEGAKAAIIEKVRGHLESEHGERL